jgi:predicted RNA-binding protein with PIN domain
MPPKKVLIVDGYNVIHQIPELKLGLSSGLENARLKLALLLSAWSHDHPATECLIVFDGDLQHAGGRDQRLAGIRCVFSRISHGGDAEIIRFVRDSKGEQADITVVSDDNSVRNNCRTHGASVQPSSYIMTKKTRPSGGRAKASADGKGIDRKAASEIDRELRKKFGL